MHEEGLIRDVINYRT